MAAHRQGAAGSGETERRLLARDRTELDAIADRLRGGRRVVAFVVCAPELGSRARAYIAEQARREVPAPEHVTFGERMLGLLAAAAEAAPGHVVSVRLDAEAPDALEALNLHREKLRRGASVILWLDDEAALWKVRQLAPDAFHFRDVVVGVVGEAAGPSQPPDPVDLELQLAQVRYNAAAGPIERAWESAVLAGLLDRRGRSDEALAILEEALWSVSHLEADPEARLARARLHGVHAETQQRLRQIDAQHHVRAGLLALAKETTPEADEERVWLWISARSPLGVDAAAPRELSRLGRLGSLGQLAHLLVAIRASEVLVRKGDLMGATMRLDQDRALSQLSDHNRAALLVARGRVAIEAGELARAGALLGEAAAIGGEGGAPGGAARDVRSAAASAELATCAHLRGEVAEARALLAPRTRAFFELALDEGNVAGALLGLETLIAQAASHHHDRPLHDACRTYTGALVRAHDAGRLSGADLVRADSALSTAEAVAVAVAEDSFPWYRVLFAVMRAEVLALRPELLGHAATVLEGAWKLAAAEWDDAEPQVARALVHVHLQAHRWDDAARVLDAAVPRAAAQRDLRELARLLAARAALLAWTGAAPEARRAAQDELRRALDETSAPRIAAEVLLELALVVPAGVPGEDPDPLALLDEAAALFSAMPLPAQHARCLEAAGDVLCAYGDNHRSARLYEEALSSLTRRGLLLRAPLLRRKRM